MEKHDFGLWSFLLLIINYLSVIDFGISNSTVVNLVQNKDNQEKQSLYFTNSLILIAFLCLILICAGIIIVIFDVQLTSKYVFDGFILIILLINAIFFHFNNLFFSVYRVFNSVNIISIYQSIIPLFLFIAMLIGEKEVMLELLMFAYLLGNIVSLFIFFYGKRLPKLGKIDWRLMVGVGIKGFFLFVNNISFYLIILSIRSIISIFYSVEDFGTFSFSFSISNSIMLFLQAIAFLIFPKLVSKLSSIQFDEVYRLIKKIRIFYTNLAFLLVYISTIFFTFLIDFIPAYKNSLTSICLISFSLVIYSTVLGFNTFLVAQNKEKLNSIITLISLVINVSVALIISFFMKLEFEYVIFSTMISYFFYSITASFFANKIMENQFTFIQVFKESIPLTFFIPYILSIIFILNGLEYYLVIPFVIHLIWNRKQIKELYSFAIKTISNKKVLDI